MINEMKLKEKLRKWVIEFDGVIPRVAGYEDVLNYIDAGTSDYRVFHDGHGWICYNSDTGIAAYDRDSMDYVIAKYIKLCENRRDEMTTKSVFEDDLREWLERHRQTVNSRANKSTTSATRNYWREMHSAYTKIIDYLDKVANSESIEESGCKKHPDCKHSVFYGCNRGLTTGSSKVIREYEERKQSVKEDKDSDCSCKHYTPNREDE